MSLEYGDEYFGTEVGLRESRVVELQVHGVLHFVPNTLAWIIDCVGLSKLVSVRVGS